MTSSTTESLGAGAGLFFFDNQLPSDGLKVLFRRLLCHSKDRRFRLLAAWLAEATLVLRGEIAKLPQPTRCQVPHFDSVLHLAEHGDWREAGLAAAIESSLLVVLQLGMLIGWVIAWRDVVWLTKPSLLCVFRVDYS